MPGFLPASPDHSVTPGDVLTERGTSKPKSESDKQEGEKFWVSGSLRAGITDLAPAAAPQVTWTCLPHWGSSASCTPFGQGRATPQALLEALDRGQLWRNSDGPSPVHCSFSKFALSAHPVPGLVLCARHAGPAPALRGLPLPSAEPVRTRAQGMGVWVAV